MIQFTTTILKFDKQGEKTGWTYILIPATKARQLNPGSKKSFRVKGRLDNYSIKQTALLPMGDGDFIIPLNVAMRKGIKKRKGDKLNVQLEIDEKPLQINPLFVECMEYEPDALKTFQKLTPSHRFYFSKWIDSAKTDATRDKRIATAVNALARGWGYGEMIRAETQKNKELRG
jgi:hypothetical protein